MFFITYKNKIVTKFYCRQKRILLQEQLHLSLAEDLTDLYAKY